jgi:hypothetical protein
MSGRQFRKVLFFVVAAGVAYWFYKDRPTVSGFVDSLTDPLMGSRAAVKSSERNRVVGDASEAISEQSDAQVGSLREGMTPNDVVELLGNPDSREDETVEGRRQVRWVYKLAKRDLLFVNGRLVSIVVR